MDRAGGRTGSIGRRTRGERDLWIVQLRERGHTLEEIGERAGLTRERVRQIIVRMGGPSASELTQRRNAERERLDRRRTTAIREDVRGHPGTTLAEIVERTGSDLATVRRALTSSERKLVVDHGARDPRSYRTWTSEALIEVLHVAALYCEPLTSGCYRELQESGEIQGPTLAVFYQRFGSWTDACAAAGFESGQRWRDYYSRWTDRDLRDLVVGYLSDPGTTGTFADFVTWLGGREGAPSSATIRNRLGTWTEMKTVALSQVPSGDRCDPGASEPGDT